MFHVKHWFAVCDLGMGVLTIMQAFGCQGAPPIFLGRSGEVLAVFRCGERQVPGPGTLFAGVIPIRKLNPPNEVRLGFRSEVVRNERC